MKESRLRSISAIIRWYSASDPSQYTTRSGLVSFAASSTHASSGVAKLISRPVRRFAATCSRAPRHGCLNVHASLLPCWRGAAPIQRALLAGDSETGITIMQMEEGLDTGAVLLAEAVAIGPTTTAQQLHDRLAELGARLIVRALDGVAQGRLAPRPQPAEGVTYAKKLRREEGALDWRRPAAELERAVRAFDPWPGAWFERGRERVRVLAAELADAPHGAAPGTVLDDRLAIACGKGALRPLILQRAGRAPQDVDAFLRGYPLPRGTVLPCPATS